MGELSWLAKVVIIKPCFSKGSKVYPPDHLDYNKISSYLCAMFVKPYIKTLKGSGDRYTVYKLCESYRCDYGVRHQIIISLGKLEELKCSDRNSYIERVRRLGCRIEELVHKGNKSPILFTDDETLEELAQKFYTSIVEKQKLDIDRNHDYQYIDTDSVKNEDVREIGSEWLCYQALEQLKLREYLQWRSWSEDDISTAMCHIISRAVYPASEHKTLHWLRQNSGVCELTGISPDKIKKDRLYRISKKLYEEKAGLEHHFSRQTNDLFDLHDSILLYDLTNTYFEGRKLNSSIARFGRSKEKRTDAKIAVLAQVVNREGFLKHSRIYEGNVSDCSTFSDLLEDLGVNTSATCRKPTLVMDAGIATESNLELARNEGYKYICVSRSGLKKYSPVAGTKSVQITDKRNHPITLQRVRCEESEDQYLYVKSQLKSVKNKSINKKLATRFELGLKQIASGVSRKGGVKRYDKVCERVGRLKEKYPRIQKLYSIEVLKDEATVNSKGKAKPLMASDIQWSKKEEQEDQAEGVYFIRTNLNSDNEEYMWDIYNAIREIESSFRCLKTDLDLRPIFHKTDAAVMAHLNLGLLAYQIVSTIRYQLKAKNIHSDWRNIVRTMNSQKCITTTMTNSKKQVISIRKCSEPEPDVKKIYDALKYKYAPFVRKKSVVPPDDVFKNATVDKQTVDDT